jgi:hypothetical protein
MLVTTKALFKCDGPQSTLFLNHSSVESDVDNWKNITNSQNSVRKKFCFSNCHIIWLDTGSLVFLVSGTTQNKLVLIIVVPIKIYTH